MEALIARWHDAPAPAQRAIAQEVEALAFEEMPYATTGQFFIPYAVRQSVRGLVEAPLPVFWGVLA